MCKRSEVKPGRRVSRLNPRFLRFPGPRQIIEEGACSHFIFLPITFLIVFTAFRLQEVSSTNQTYRQHADFQEGQNLEGAQEGRCCWHPRASQPQRYTCEAGQGEGRLCLLP